MTALKKYWEILSVLLLAAFLSSCSDGGGNDGDEIALNEVVGTWNSSENAGDCFVFLNDGSGYSLIDGFREYFDWSFKDNVLVLMSNDWDSEYRVEVRISGSNLTFVFDGQTYSKAYTPVKDDEDGDKSESKSDYDPNLVGEWWFGDVLKSLNKYCFCKNGKGYRIASDRDGDYGLKYVAFSWNTKEAGKLEIKQEGYSSTIYEYIIDGENLKVTTNGFTFNWRRMGDDVDEDFDATKPPFNNYLKNKNTDYYYQITKMTSGCNHAGTGDNMNDKFLHFFGSDGTLTTTGLRIVYYTPRWEGIDSSWSSGSYTMSGTSGAYRYIAMAWCRGARLDTYQGGRLKIAQNGSITTYDFDDKEIELHVVVKKE